MHLPEEVQTLIGKESVRTCEITQKEIKRFAQAIGDTNPLYFDAEYASKTKHGGIVAPPLFFQALTFDDVPVENLPPDGSPQEINIPVPAQRTVGGSSQYDFYIRARPGDVVTVKSKLNNIFTKVGRSGLLYFIEVKTSFYNAESQLMAQETATYIKRI